MAAKDPLRQLMDMAEDFRSNVDSMVSQGTKSVQASLPELPFPGEGKAKLPSPTGILAKLPKLPSLPIAGAEKAAAPTPTPISPTPTPLAIREGYKLRDAWHPTGYQLRT